MIPSQHRGATVATFGLIFFVGSVLIGFSIHKQGYGTGPDGIIEMLLGVGIGLVGCVASFIMGIVSLTRGEHPYAGLAAIGAPTLLVLLSITGVIRL